MARYVYASLTCMKHWSYYAMHVCSKRCIYTCISIRLSPEKNGGAHSRRNEKNKARKTIKLNDKCEKVAMLWIMQGCHVHHANVYDSLQNSAKRMQSKKKCCALLSNERTLVCWNREKGEKKTTKLRDTSSSYVCCNVYRNRNFSVHHSQNSCQLEIYVKTFKHTNWNGMYGLRGRLFCKRSVHNMIQKGNQSWLNKCYAFYRFRFFRSCEKNIS